MPSQKLEIEVEVDASGAVSGIKQITKASDDSAENQQKKNKGLLSGLKKLKGSYIAVAAAVTAFATGLFKVIGVAARFEAQIARVAAVSGGATKELERIARAAGKDTVFSATQAAEALELLALAGLNTAESAKTLTPALNLATAANIGVAQAVDIVVGQLKTFQKESDNAGKFVDILARTTQSSNTNIEQLGFALSFAGSSASLAGASFEDTNAILGALADIGIKGSRAGTQLRQAFAKLTAPTKAATKTLAKYGIAQEEVNQLLPTPIKLFKRLRDANLSTADALKILGVRQSGIFAVIKNNIPQLEALREKIELAGGAAQTAADIQLKTFTGQSKLLGSALQELVLGIFKEGGFLSGLTGIVTALKNATIFMGSFFAISEDMSDGLRDQEKALKNNRIQFNAEIGVLKRGNISQDQRRKLIKKLNTEYKEFLPRLIEEKDTTKDLTALQKAGNEALLRKIVIKGREKEITITINKIAKEQEKIAERELKILDLKIQNQAIRDRASKIKKDTQKDLKAFLLEQFKLNKQLIKIEEIQIGKGKERISKIDKLLQSHDALTKRILENIGAKKKSIKASEDLIDSIKNETGAVELSANEIKKIREDVASFEKKGLADNLDENQKHLEKRLEQIKKHGSDIFDTDKEIQAAKTIIQEEITRNEFEQFQERLSFVTDITKNTIDAIVFAWDTFFVKRVDQENKFSDQLKALDKEDQERTKKDLQEEIDAAKAAGDTKLADEKQRSLDRIILQEKAAAKDKEIKTETAKREKELSIFSATAQSFIAIAKAIASAPPPLNIPAIIAASIASGLQIVAAIAQPLPKFAFGGTLGGGSSSGDRTLFGGNRGETILNTNQGQNLFNALERSGLLSGQTTNSNVVSNNITNNNGNTTSVGSVSLSGDRSFERAVDNRFAQGGDFT